MLLVRWWGGVVVVVAAMCVGLVVSQRMVDVSTPPDATFDCPFCVTVYRQLEARCEGSTLSTDSDASVCLGDVDCLRVEGWVRRLDPDDLRSGSRHAEDVASMFQQAFTLCQRLRVLDAFCHQNDGTQLEEGALCEGHEAEYACWMMGACAQRPL